MSSEIRKQLVNIKTKIDKKEMELIVLKNEQFKLEVELKRTKEITTPITNNLPLFTRIVFGKETIRISRNSSWKVSTLEKINPETGKKYTRYQTIIEADPTSAYGFKCGHRSYSYSSSFFSYSSCSYEWISFETEHKLIPNSITYILSEEDEKNLYEDKNEIVNTEKILMFGTLIQENFEPWVYHPFPELKFY